MKERRKSLNRGRDKVEIISEEITSRSLIFKETKQNIK
jgi:hypothetical protein